MKENRDEDAEFDRVFDEFIAACRRDANRRGIWMIATVLLPAVVLMAAFVILWLRGA